ncbi:hypothetical protein MB901379_02622 [Mycobacterium basiliense]|uniref:Uncharacterized protein n=1 Tax=Mycobacterium basiliense TaxID=2094119 RepID=A0A3S4BG19_9MYCO|nr:hypothetical protein MB901379_02622 [Mycobacterium basiliense]
MARELSEEDLRVSPYLGRADGYVVRLVDAVADCSHPGPSGVLATILFLHSRHVTVGMQPSMPYLMRAPVCPEFTVAAKASAVAKTLVTAGVSPTDRDGPIDAAARAGSIPDAGWFERSVDRTCGSFVHCAPNARAKTEEGDVNWSGWPTTR